MPKLRHYVKIQPQIEPWKVRKLVDYGWLWAIPACIGFSLFICYISVSDDYWKTFLIGGALIGFLVAVVGIAATYQGAAFSQPAPKAAGAPEAQASTTAPTPNTTPAASPEPAAPKQTTTTTTSETQKAKSVEPSLPVAFDDGAPQEGWTRVTKKYSVSTTPNKALGAGYETVKEVLVGDKLAYAYERSSEAVKGGYFRDFVICDPNNDKYVNFVWTNADPYVINRYDCRTNEAGQTEYSKYDRWIFFVRKDSIDPL